MSRQRSRRVIHLVVLAAVPLLALSNTTTGGRAVARDRAVGARAPSTAADRSTPHIADITLRLDPRRRSFGAHSETWGDNLVFDKNRDGHPDVLLSFHAGRWPIWLGTRTGKFVYDRSLRFTDRHECVTADFSGPRGIRDGRPDLYCVRGANKGTLNDKANELLIQRADGSFVDKISSWGAADPSGRGRTVSVLHIRHNGRPSLFLGDAESIEYPSLDHIYENTGRHFVSIRTAGLPSERNTYCSSTADFDHDGREDFLACSYSLRLYRNLTTHGGPTVYREVAGKQGLGSAGRTDAGFVDLNNDGWADLVTVTNKALTVRLNRHVDPHFSTVSYRLPLMAGFSFCSGAANGDQAPDLMVVQGLVHNTERVQRPDWMLINAGGGRAFRALPVPQPPFKNGANGNGDTCTAIPHYRGAKAAWIIDNGRPTYWPREIHHLGYRQVVIYDR
jgi:hypothetical protein